MVVVKIHKKMRISFLNAERPLTDSLLGIIQRGTPQKLSNYLLLYVANGLYRLLEGCQLSRPFEQIQPFPKECAPSV